MKMQKKKKRGAFTLIEVLVVIAILGLLGSFAVLKYMSYLKRAAVKTAEMKLREVGKALEIYYSQNMKYPETLDELVNPEEEGKEGVLKPSALLDPWKHEIQYTLHEGEDPPFSLISLGPDGQEGTDDDIDYGTIEENQEEPSMDGGGGGGRVP